MASAYLDKRSGGWVASYRPLHASGSQRRLVRIPPGAIRPDHEQEDAQLYAEDCDHCCRLLESSADPQIIKRAEERKAITLAQATALRAGLPAPSHHTKTPEPWTIKAAAMAHPSTIREAQQRPQELMRHLRELDAFTIWSGINRLSDLTLEHVTGYLSHLKERGSRWDGRRHRLLYIRRACAMAGTQGLPNIIGDLVLDRREDDEMVEIEGWTWSELLAGATALQADPDRRLIAVLALGGFCGLRSSEIARVRCGHLSDTGVLTVGKEERKTKASRRDIPLAPRVVAWLRPLTFAKDGSRRPADDLLVRGRGNQHQGRPMTPRRLSELWSPAMEIATKRKGLTVKHLRKSWFTWAVQSGLPLSLVEAYGGHRATMVLPVTSAHYLIAAQCALYRPIADAVEMQLVNL